MTLPENPLCSARRSAVALPMAVVLMFMATTGTEVDAASDGSFGATSSGDSSVSISKTAAVKISGLDDVAFGSVLMSPSEDLTLSEDLCVYSSASGTYSLLVTSNNSGFNLQSGGESMPYRLEWNDTPVDYGTTLADLPGNSSDPDCSGSTNVTMKITVAAVDVQAAPSGTYSDTLTLQVASE